MKKLLLSLGALSAVVAPVAAVVACGSKTETPAKPKTPATPAKTKEVAKQVKLEENQKVFVLGFTFGVKATDLNTDQSDFTTAFKTKLTKAGFASTAPVTASIKTDGMNQAQKAAGFVAIASTGIDVISTDGTNPAAADELAVIKAQLKLSGISEIFSHVQADAIAFKDVTEAAKATPSKSMFTTTNKYAVVNNLQAVMFVA